MYAIRSYYAQDGVVGAAQVSLARQQQHAAGQCGRLLGGQRPGPGLVLPLDLLDHAAAEGEDAVERQVVGESYNFV